MVTHEPKACQFCGDTFLPHAKVGPRQIACEKSACKKERVKQTRRQWYKKNPGYNYDNVKRYRQEHPDYQKQWRHRRKENHRKSLTTLIPPEPNTTWRAKREIQNQLTLAKTTTHIELHRVSEIQNKLSLCFSIPLCEFFQSIPALHRREIQNQLTI